MNHLFNVASTVIVALLLTNGAQAESVDKHIDADAHGEVEIVNVAGSVLVTGWDRSEVQVHADLGRNVERLDVQRDGEHISVKVVLASGKSMSGGTELEVRVPRDSRLVTTTVSATQVIEGVRGSQRLQSVSGNIQTQVWGGEFQAKTVSGEVTAKGQGTKEKPASGQVRVTTVSGDVDIVDLGNELELHTVTGDMNVSTQNLDRAHIKTTNGNFHLRASMTRDAHVDAEAVNGDLSFELLNTINADVDIETFNGDIDNCFGPKPKQIHEHGPGTELRFKEGDGHAQVRIKTLNGTVNVCRK